MGVQEVATGWQWQQRRQGEAEPQRGGGNVGVAGSRRFDQCSGIGADEVSRRSLLPTLAGLQHHARM